MFDVKEFLDREIDLYATNMERQRNLRAYVDLIKPEGYKIFPKSSIRNTTTKPEGGLGLQRGVTKEYNVSSKIR